MDCHGTMFHAPSLPLTTHKLLITCMHNAIMYSGVYIYLKVLFKSKKSGASITTVFAERLRFLAILNVSSYIINNQGAEMIAIVLQEAVSLTQLHYPILH